MFGSDALRNSLMCAGAAVLLLTAVVSDAGAVPSVPEPGVGKTREVKLWVDLAGYVETELIEDSTSPCSPGVAYTQFNNYDFDTGKPHKVSVKSISVPGMDSAVVTSPFSKPSGSAVMESAYSGYKTTNSCAPTPPSKLPPPPKCSKSKGKVSVAFTQASADDPGDLAPLRGREMMLDIRRSGGGSDDISCYGPGASGFASGPASDQSVITTSPNPGVNIIVASGLDGSELFNIKKKAVKKTVVAFGPCDKVRINVYNGDKTIKPAQGYPKKDGECWLRAKLVLSIKKRA
jgi:hypothetical protein